MDQHETSTNRPAKCARKRPVNLTLSEDLVAEARTLTQNLSGVVEALLADFVSREPQRREGVADNARATAALWNAFGEDQGSFADDHSTL